MKIAVIADKKLGHLSQCLGLREIIKEYNKKKDIFFLHQDLIALPGFLERTLTLINEKLYLLFLKLLNPNIIDHKYDLVICSAKRCIVLVRPSRGGVEDENGVLPVRHSG